MKLIIIVYFFYLNIKFINSSLYKNLTLGPEVVLPHYYVKEIRPSLEEGRPVVVDFNIFVVDINSINVEDMDFRLSWTETRLHMPEDIFEKGDDYVTLPPEFFDKLWQPDPYFLNSKVAEIAALTHKFSSVTLYRNKTVTYSARMHAIVACQMEFQLYPMDIQICPIYIESFSYNSQKLQLKWAANGVTVNPELKLLQYNFGEPQLLEEIHNYITEKIGNYSRLTVFFRFERQIGHHLIQTFAPSILVVMLSWFSFWLGLDAIPGRVTLLVTSMLTLVTMFTGLKSDIPPVAYVKALDLWMAGCMIFVFASLSEFVVVKVIDGRQKQLELQLNNLRNYRASVERSVSIWDYEASLDIESNHKRTGSKDLLQRTWLDPEPLRPKRTLSKKIDYYSRVIFPSLFLLFTILYWPIVILKKRN
ncbi:glycine receptor subunit alpha-2 isoform X2 [Microplitis mediator]|uniref:glycine receptor subunit alpha-2 isoform X2 n=1 Tax=Microplitis mediator TaxID=375433 RepID=UPI0025577857|nr:glycine receptor subunit alpha-2 isoform X2 [Microplitis mediator]